MGDKINCYYYLSLSTLRRRSVEYLFCHYWVSPSLTITAGALNTVTRLRGLSSSLT